MCFTSYVYDNYNFFSSNNPNRQQNNLTSNRRTKYLILASDTYNDYMTTYSRMTNKPKFNLPKIKMLGFHEHFNSTLPNESKVFNYRINNKTSKLKMKQNKEDLLDSITCATQTSTEFSTLNIFYQNKEPLMNSMLSFLLSHLLLKENPTWSKSTTIKTKRSQIDLTIESICLVFNKKNVQDKQCLKVPLPFDFMPFFYGINQDIFLFFLSKIVNMSTHTSKISIDYNELKDNVEKFTKFVPLFKGDSHLYKNLKQKVTNWKYDWIIGEHIYQMSIELPMVNCMLYGNSSKQKVKLSKMLEHNVLVELLKNHFVNWDNAILMFLSEYKVFREHAKELNHFKSIFTKQIITIALDRPILGYDSNRQFYDFFITSKDQTFYIKLYSYEFNITLNFKNEDSISPRQNSRGTAIPTNLCDIYKLERLKEYFDLSELIRKCMVINKERIELNSDIYNTIDERLLTKEMKINTNEKTISVVYDEDSTRSPRAMLKEKKEIEVVNPRLNWKVFGKVIDQDGNDKVKFVDNTTELSPSFVSDLLQCNINEWSSVIQVHQKSFEEELTLFCTKRRSSISKGRSPGCKRTLTKSPSLVKQRKTLRNRGEIVSLILA